MKAFFHQKSPILSPISLISMINYRFLFLTFVVFSLGIFACNERKMPIYFEGETPPAFKMMNQEGKIVTEKEMKGKVYIVDFFFSTCPGVCKDMTKNMRKVQGYTNGMWDVHLVSFSVDPETDSVAQLKKYAQEYGVIAEKWDLLTGNYQSVFDLAQKTFHVSALKDAKADGGIFHDEQFILIDKKNRIRGFYHVQDSVKLKALIRDIQYLRKEEGN